ncbi:hypothetical protein BHE74_00045966 [Ensete ventricosum]|nr:hypothetical protein BHE74_00045966 [Ensete ventricosum]
MAGRSLAPATLRTISLTFCLFLESDHGEFFLPSAGPSSPAPQTGPVPALESRPHVTAAFPSKNGPAASPPSTSPPPPRRRHFVKYLSHIAFR